MADALVPSPLSPPQAIRSPHDAFLDRCHTPQSRLTMLKSLAFAAERFGLPDAKTAAWHQLRREHIEKLISDLLEDEYAPASINRVLSALRGVARLSWEHGLFVDERDYHRLIAVKNVRGQRPLAGRVLAAAEVLQLFEACQGATPQACRDHALLCCAYYAGMRRAEISALPTENLGEEERQLKVLGKGNKLRHVPIATVAVESLVRWQKASGTVGRFFDLSEGGVYFVLSQIGARAGVRHYSPHDLRRTFITELLDRGNDPITVARLAGHDDVNTTMRYDRRGEQAARVAADSLGPAGPAPEASASFCPHCPHCRRSVQKATVQKT